MSATLSLRQEEGRAGGRRIHECHVGKGFISLVNEFGFILMLLRDKRV